MCVLVHNAASDAVVPFAFPCVNYLKKQQSLSKPLSGLYNLPFHNAALRYRITRLLCARYL